MNKLKNMVTACSRCGKRRRKKEHDSEYCTATDGLVLSAKDGTHTYGGHLWIRTKKGYDNANSI